MSEYEPRGQGGWPAQPPVNGQADHRQGGHRQGGHQPGYGQQGGYGQPQQAIRRPRRRRHGCLISLLVVLVVILVILGVGDQVARSYAQGRIASQIQSSADMSAKPSVSIKGWPFLTQVASKDLKEVDIKADNVTTSGGKLPVSFSAKATGVHVNSSFNGATVDHMTGQATITYQALDSYLGQSIGLPGLTAITFSPDPSAGPDVVKADFGIGSVDATVTKTSASQLTITFGKLGGIASLAGGAGSIQPQVIDIPKLPAGLTIGQPTVNSQGVVIPASASNTTLTQ